MRKYILNTRKIMRILKNFIVNAVITKVLVICHPINALIVTLVTSNILVIVAYTDSSQVDNYEIIINISTKIFIFAATDVLLKVLIRKIGKIEFDCNKSSHIHVLTVLFIINLVFCSFLWNTGSPFFYFVHLSIEYSFAGGISAGNLWLSFFTPFITTALLIYLHISIMDPKNR